MKATKCHMERTYNLGNYESVRLLTEVQLDDGEKASDAFAKLKESLDKTFQKLHGHVPEVPGALAKQSGLTATQLLDKKLSK